MATTTNYSWTTPDDTALVKDGAAAIRSLGSAIDTTVFNNANAAIAKTIVDAKGDIIAATAADTVARLAVGANDTVLTADSSTATGLKWAAPSSGSMTLISTTTLTGATVSLTSIPQTYKDLRLVLKDFLHTGAGNNTLQFIVNSTNSIYASQNGSTALTGTAVNTSVADLVSIFRPAIADNFSVSDLYDYANTTTYKYLNAFNFSSDAATTWSIENMRTGIRTTSAISSITFSLATGSFNGGSVELYGVN